MISQPGSGFYYLAVSMKDERFANPKVREALRYLIDYKGINAAIMPYYGQEHQLPISTGFLGAMPDPGYTLDVDKAKALLAEAGYPDGFKVSLRALADAPFMSAATAIQGTLKQAGIDAEIISGSGDQIYGAMRERNFELLVGRGGGGQLPHPDSNLRAIIYNPDNSDEAKLTNFQGWRTSFFDPELNTAIDAALVETDPAKQEAMYQGHPGADRGGGAVDPALLRGAQLGRLPRRPRGLRAQPLVGHRPRRHHQGALTPPRRAPSVGAPVTLREMMRCD